MSIDMSQVQEFGKGFRSARNWYGKICLLDAQKPLKTNAKKNRLGLGDFVGKIRSTPWKTNIDPENHWLVEANTLPGGQDVRVYVSFRECIVIRMPFTRMPRWRSQSRFRRKAEHMISMQDLRRSGGQVDKCWPQIYKRPQNNVFLFLGEVVVVGYFLLL